MKETLHIKNFGPIKDVKLELGKVNVLIGDQGTGKTSIGKILCICRYFSYIVGINEGGMQSAFSEWGLYESVMLDTEIHYSCDNYSLSIVGKEIPYTDRDQNGEEFINYYWDLSSTLISNSETFSNLQVELQEERYPLRNKMSTINFNYTPPEEPSPYFYQSKVNKVMVNPFFLSSDRVLQSLFSLGKSSLQNISNSLFNQFSKLDGIQRKFISDIDIGVFKLSYKNESGVGRYKLDNSDVYFHMDNAPSGIKTSLPIILVIKYYTEILRKNKFFIIDEPENSLFPKSQQQLISFLVNRTVNYSHPITKNKFNNQLLLTTHSPYILTSLNNLMYAFTVGKNHSEKTDDLIEKEYWLNPDDVSAYMMQTDGTCVDIMDREEGMIKAEKIDEVSNVLNEQFDELMNIEHNFKKHEL